MNAQKSRFILLDGLRGVAAFAVVAFHISFFWKSGDVLPRAYLAVDFFFLLSGFVIARAYENSLRTSLTFEGFFIVRIIRLYPLMMLSMVCGLLTEASKLYLGHHQVYHFTYTQLAEQFLFAACFFPYVFATAKQPMFPLNPPAWSLFEELVSNLAYAGAIKFLTDKWLVLLVTLAAAVLGYTVLSNNMGDGGALLGGYKVGAARVFFSFFGGVLLYRLHERRMFEHLPKIPAFGLVAALLLSFASCPKQIDGLCDLACVMLLYPLIIAVGAADHLPVGLTPIALWFGRISYPVYVLHWPTIYRNSFRIYDSAHGLGRYAVLLAAMVATAIVAQLSLMFYDKPVRQILSSRLGRQTVGRRVRNLETSD